MGRRRLDTELVRRGLAATEAEAQAAVRDGLVTVAGVPANKPATLVAPTQPVRVLHAPRRFVSRGGDKLAAGLDRFGVDPARRDCLDAGASTGGFTDCLLQRGAARVAAVDVGYGQLAWSLRNDRRVVVIERTNVRDLRSLPFAPGVVTADLSFTSLAGVIPALAGVSGPRADFVFLVKPQFEARPADVGSGGVVRDPAVWHEVLGRVIDACRAGGVEPLDAMASPVVGPAGNVEFLLHARRDVEGRPIDVERAVAEGRALGGRT